MKRRKFSREFKIEATRAAVDHQSDDVTGGVVPRGVTGRFVDCNH
ncbi:dihydrodipicolinate synthase/N-acetylneuraminate lyase [Bradyrhizobium diazoefficiens]